MYYTLEAERINHELLIKEAEQARLASELAQEARHDAFNPALAWVGQRMVDIGSSLVKLAGAPKTEAADLN